jgi:hypothetical protein
MSHLVIHTPVDGTTQYRQFGDLATALQFIEVERNAGTDDASLFELREIPLEVTSYIKVEVAGSAVASVEATPEVETPVPPTAEPFVSAVAPIGQFGRPAPAEPTTVPFPEGRRGLFGR